MTSIDLNADLGEGMGTDDDLLGIVSSASIACGGHAGDAATTESKRRWCSSHSASGSRWRMGRFQQPSRVA